MTITATIVTYVDSTSPTSAATLSTCDIRYTPSNTATTNDTILAATTTCTNSDFTSISSNFTSTGYVQLYKTLLKIKSVLFLFPAIWMVVFLCIYSGVLLCFFRIIASPISFHHLIGEIGWVSQGVYMREMRTNKQGEVL